MNPKSPEEIARELESKWYESKFLYTGVETPKQDRENLRVAITKAIQAERDVTENAVYRIKGLSKEIEELRKENKKLGIKIQHMTEEDIEEINSLKSTNKRIGSDLMKMIEVKKKMKGEIERLKKVAYGKAGGFAEMADNCMKENDSLKAEVEKWDGMYTSAVKGRQDFRQALKKKVLETRELHSLLREAVGALEKLINKRESMWSWEVNVAHEILTKLKEALGE